MALRHRIRPFTVRTLAGCALTALLAAGSIVAGVRAQGVPLAPVTIDSARVSIAGTSNIHPYTASTTAVHVTHAQLASGAGNATWDAMLRPGALEAFDVTIAAATLTSPREGLDANMHKALNVAQFPEITFRLRRIDGAADARKAVGVLRIAGVDREVTLAIHTERKDAALVVKGELTILMTDFGITPPKALMGMLKTDPKVTVTFEAALAIPARVTTTVFKH